MVDDLSGKVIKISQQDKPLYHAALCFASNYLITIEHLAVNILEQTGIEKTTALRLLLPLIRGASENLHQQGLPDALAGPISGGDVNTIRSHLTALSKMPEDYLLLYQSLGLASLEIAREKGKMNADSEQRTRRLLEQE